MGRFPFRRQVKQAASYSVACALLALSCLPLTGIGPHDIFELRWAPASDAISPYGPIVICFSYPVRYPDSVACILRPHFTDYHLRANTTADTFTLECLLPLKGSTRYSLKLASWVESVEESFLAPGTDSLVFHTLPIEQEPNNSMATADTLHAVVFGSIATVNDTDWFALRNPAVQAVYLVSTGSSSTFEIRDAHGSFVRPPSFKAVDTLAVPQTFLPPLHVVVYAYNRSNGGHYRLGTVPR